MTTMVTLHPSLADTRAFAIAISSELFRFILTVSLSRSATISKAI